MIGGISPISGYVGFPGYIPYQNRIAGNTGVGGASFSGAAESAVPGVSKTRPGEEVTGVQQAKEDNKKATTVGKADASKECQTCKNRKYQDGSDENVSFKSPQKISPQAAASRVRGHEQEHVNNAFKKAAGMKEGKVIQASVSMKMEICPECGKPYIAGGETTTKIAYKKDNPYARNQKSAQQEATSGKNIDMAV